MIRHHPIARLSAALLLLATAGPVLAQTGTLTYGPAAAAGGATVQAVPIPPLLLLPLAIALALLGGRFLRREQGKKLLGALLLVTAAGLGAVSSVHIPQAIADLLMITLDQPEVGSVEIPLQAASYTNSSGVELTITGITPPPACATTSPAQECGSGLTLADGDSCTTAYTCTQTVAFTSTAPTGAVVGNTYAVTATASSGLPVVFSSATTGVCTVTGATVSFVAAGECLINVDQAGDTTYSPAPQLQQTITVERVAQTLTFTSTAPTGTTVGGTYTVTATTSSGLPVAFSSASPTVCTVTGSTVSFIAAGTCLINADQAGDTTYSPAPQLQQIMTVTSVPPEVTVTKTTDGVEGTTPTPGAFTLTRSGSTTNPLTVTFTLGGTATGIAREPTFQRTDDEDYRVDSLTEATFPAGASTIELPITVLDDQVYDPSETVSLTLSGNPAYTVGTNNSAELTITAPDKRIFVTASTYNGNLGGVAGADAKCNADSARPDRGISYKAMLGSPGVREALNTPRDWVLQAGVAYFASSNGNRYIARTNAAGVFAFDLSAAFAAPPVTEAWTGLSGSWRTVGSACSQWTENSFFRTTVVGDPTARTGRALYATEARGCSNRLLLYCAEQ